MINHISKIKCLIFLTLVINVIQLSFAGEEELTYSKKWIECQSDNECVAVEGACGGLYYVNKLYAEEAQKYQKQMSALVECDAWHKPNTSVISCVNKECVSTDSNIKDDNLLPNQGSKAFYKNLREKCSSNCCEVSVNRMERERFPLADQHLPLQDADCPEGYRATMLKCPDSYRWCEPVKKTKNQ